MKNKRQNIELELHVTTSSNSHVQVTVTAPLLFPGKILGYTEIRRGQVEKSLLFFINPMTNSVPWLSRPTTRKNLVLE
jgi:hypothetical protein